MGYFNTAWRHIRRGPFQSLSALLVVTSNFLMISFFAFLLLGFSQAIRYLEGKPEIVAFLKDDFNQAQAQSLVSDLENHSGVREVRFITQEDALKIYKEDNKDNPLLLEMVTADILPASIEIAAEKPSSLINIASELEAKSDLFLEVSFQRDIVDRLEQLVGLIRTIGIIVSGFLVVVSILVVSVLVGMKVTIKRKEIGVYRLLGAGKGYINFPYIIEGAVYGLGGAIIGWGLTFLAFWQMRPKIEPFFGDIPFYATTVYPYLILLAVQVLGGVLIGLFSSVLAVRRHAKK
jgi:cell division transport system permease protein